MFPPMVFSNYFHASVCTSHNNSLIVINNKVLNNLAKCLSSLSSRPCIFLSWEINSLSTIWHPSKPLFYFDCRSICCRCFHFNWPLIYQTFVFEPNCKIPCIFCLFMAQVRFNFLYQVNALFLNLSFFPSFIANTGIWKYCRLFQFHKPITTHWVSKIYPFPLNFINIMLEGPNGNFYQSREYLFGQVFSIVINCS